MHPSSEAAMQILDTAISWARANLNIAAGALAFGVTQWLLTMLKLQYLLGLATAIAYLVGRFVEVALTPKVPAFSAPQPLYRRKH